MTPQEDRGLMYVIHKYDERISVALDKYKAEIDAYNDGWAHATNEEANNERFDVYTFRVDYGGPWGKKEWFKSKSNISKNDVNLYMSEVGIQSVWTGVELRTKEDNMGCFMFVKIVREGEKP